MVLDEVWSLAKAPMFSLTEKSKQLGLGSKGVTKYFSSNCDEVRNTFYVLPVNIIFISDVEILIVCFNVHFSERCGYGQPLFQGKEARGIYQPSYQNNEVRRVTDMYYDRSNPESITIITQDYYC